MAGRWMRGRKSLPAWVSTVWILSVAVVGVAADGQDHDHRSEGHPHKHYEQPDRDEFV